MFKRLEGDSGCAEQQGEFSFKMGSPLRGVEQPNKKTHWAESIARRRRSRGKKGPLGTEQKKNRICFEAARRFD